MHRGKHELGREVNCLVESWVRIDKDLSRMVQFNTVTLTTNKGIKNYGKTHTCMTLTAFIVKNKYIKLKGCCCRCHILLPPPHNKNMEKKFNLIIHFN
jgi:hypothetical protein